MQQWTAFTFFVWLLLLLLPLADSAGWIPCPSKRMRRYLGCPDCTDEFKKTRPWRYAYCCQCRDPNGPDPVEITTALSEKNSTGPTDLAGSVFSLGAGLPPDGGFFAGSLLGSKLGGTASTSNSSETFKSLLEKNRIDLFGKGENGLFPLFGSGSLENSTRAFNLKGLNSSELEPAANGTGFNTFTITTVMEERNKMEEKITVVPKNIVGKPKISSENSVEVDKLLKLFGNSEILVILPQGSVDKAGLLTSHNLTVATETPETNNNLTALPFAQTTAALPISNLTETEHLNMTDLQTTIVFTVQGNQTLSSVANILELINATTGSPIIVAERFLPALPPLNHTDILTVATFPITAETSPTFAPVQPQPPQLPQVQVSNPFPEDLSNRPKLSAPDPLKPPPVDVAAPNRTVNIINPLAVTQPVASPSPVPPVSPSIFDPLAATQPGENPSSAPPISPSIQPEIPFTAPPLPNTLVRDINSPPSDSALINLFPQLTKKPDNNRTFEVRRHDPPLFVNLPATDENRQPADESSFRMLHVEKQPDFFLKQ